MAGHGNAFEAAGHNLGVVIRASAHGGAPAMRRLGVFSVAEMKRELSHHGRGRVYPRGRKTHQASAPGDPPAVDTGQYRASWDWLVRVTSQAIELLIGTPDKRAPWLEFGTSRMDPRPHLRTLIERLRASGVASAIVGDFVLKAQQRAIRGLHRG